MELSVTEAARYYNRTEVSIRRWCRNGTLLAAGCRVMRDVTGRWIIILPLGQQSNRTH
jgi:hypothetical protein